MPTATSHHGTFERVDAVPDRLFEPGRGDEPPAHADRRAEYSGNPADRRAASNHHQAKVLLGRPDRGHHAQLTLTSLGDHDEARRRHQRDQEQRDRRDHEHTDGGDDVLGDVGAKADEPLRVAWRTKVLDPLLGRVDQHRDRIDLHRPGHGEDELVVQVAGVLDQPDHGAVGAVERKVLADGQVEALGDPVGHRELVIRRRKTAVGQVEQRPAERAVGLLGAVVQRVDSTPHGHRRDG